MKPFIPVLAFVVVSFALLAASISCSNPDFALRPLLYLARLSSWAFALTVATLPFLPALLRNRLGVRGATLLAALAIVIFYPCDGFLKAHAEERVIRYKTTHRNPHDDMGPHYLYGSFSPGTGGSSRGAWDAAESAWHGLQGCSVFALIWFPFVLFIARFVFSHPAPAGNTRNA